MAFCQADLKFQWDEFTGVLLDEDETDPEVDDVGEVLSWKVMVPFAGVEENLPVGVAFDIRLDSEGVIGIKDRNRFISDLFRYQCQGRFYWSMEDGFRSTGEGVEVDPFAEFQW